MTTHPTAPKRVALLTDAELERIRYFLRDCDALGVDIDPVGQLVRTCRKLLAHIAALSRPQVAEWNRLDEMLQYMFSSFDTRSIDWRMRASKIEEEFEHRRSIALKAHKEFLKLRNAMLAAAPSTSQAAEWQHIEELMKEVRVMGATQPSYTGTWKKVDELFDAIRRRAAAPSTAMGDDHKPYAYAYRYPHHGGGTVVRFDTGGREINGSKPIETIPLYLHPAPATPAQPDAVAELVRLAEAWVEARRQLCVERGSLFDLAHACNEAERAFKAALDTFATTLAAGGK